MKIGLVCPYNIARGGGVREHVLDLRAQLVKRGHEVKIITPFHRDAKDYKDDGVIFAGTATDWRSPSHTTVQLSATTDTDDIDRMLAAEAFDILHFHEPWIPMLSRQVLSRSKCVNIATFHAKIPETMTVRIIKKIVTPYMRLVLKYLHELTAVSDAAAEYIGSLTDQPVAIIPNGINLSFYNMTAPRPVEASPKKMILYVGRLEKRKGVKYLLNAYRLLAQENPGVSLVLAGDGPDREKLEAQVKELQLPNVTFLGYVSDEMKLDLLRQADLFCSPAIYGESFGIVLLEAMAMGLVTVAGDNSGYASVMQGVGSVSLVNPKDSIEFARRLNLLLNEPSVRKLWQQWAKSYVKQFDFPNIAKQYEQFYLEALAEHGKHTHE